MESRAGTRSFMAEFPRLARARAWPPIALLRAGRYPAVKDAPRTGVKWLRHGKSGVSASHITDQDSIIGTHGSTRVACTSVPRCSLDSPRGALLRRHRPGLIPTASRNLLLRCTWSANPQASATSASGSVIPLIITLRDSLRYRRGCAWPARSPSRAVEACPRPVSTAALIVRRPSPESDARVPMPVARSSMIRCRLT